MQLKLENYITWIITIIFTAGMIYANVIKIPEIEKCQQRLEIKQSVSDANYVNIKETLFRIERKIDGRR